jgi:hypothetical protein
VLVTGYRIQQTCGKGPGRRPPGKSNQVVGPQAATQSDGSSRAQ